MSTSISSIPAHAKLTLSPADERLATNPAGMTPALMLCCDAWAKTLKHHRAIGTNPVSCYVRANEAYRAAMPPLTTARNIQDFIACTAFGIMNGPIALLLAPKLLYAAQVATANLRRPASKSESSNPRAKREKTAPRAAPATKSKLKRRTPTPVAR
jgi:hypothetical protein